MCRGETTDRIVLHDALLISRKSLLINICLFNRPHARAAAQFLATFSDLSQDSADASATFIGPRPTNRKPNGWLASGKLSVRTEKRAKLTTATAGCISGALVVQSDAFVGRI